MIAVTGAGGFIGSHLTDALLERGNSVLALDVGRKLPDFWRTAGNAVLASIRGLIAGHRPIGIP